MTEPRTELQRNALAAARRQELSIFQRALDVQWLNSRMENKRMGCLLAQIKQESEMEKEYQERTDHAALVDTRAARETALAFEIAKVRQEEVCHLQRRHFLRERDPNLKELMKKLEAGYTCRDLKQQILHNEYKRLQEKATEKQANKLLLAALDDKGEKIREEKEKLEREAEYRRELQQQLVNKQRERQCHYEDTLIEKKMLDEIIRTIADEDKKELEQKRRLTEQMRSEMKTFHEARNAWRDKHKKMVVNEEYEIEAQVKAMSDRNAAVVAERQRVLKAREDINNMISAKIQAEADAKKKRDDVIESLKEQEYLEKGIQDDIADKAKSNRVRDETNASLNAQIAIRKRQAEEQKARDLEIRRHTEALVAEGDQKELEKKRLLREKNRKYAAELLQQAELKRSKHAADKQDEEARNKAVKDYNRNWDNEVAAERRKIVEDHAPHLLGCLQVGVLRREDLPDVRTGANRVEALSKLDIEGMARPPNTKYFPKCNPQCMILREY